MKRIILTIATFSLGFLMVSAQNAGAQEQEAVKSKSPSVQQKIDNSDKTMYKKQPQQTPVVNKATIAPSPQNDNTTNGAMEKKAPPASAEKEVKVLSTPASKTVQFENESKEVKEKNEKEEKTPVIPATPASKDVNGVKTPPTPASPALQNSQKGKSKGKGNSKNAVRK